MSSATIRQGIVNYLASVPGINVLYKDEPWFADPTEWENSVSGVGTVAYIHISRETEERLTVVGPNAGGLGKKVTYDIDMVLLYQYAIPDQPVSKDSWVDGLDALLNNIKVKIRADPTFGGIAWQAGEGDGGPDISIERELPKESGGYVLSWNVLQFKAIEMLTS